MFHGILGFISAIVTIPRLLALWGLVSKTVAAVQAAMGPPPLDPEKKEQFDKEKKQAVTEAVLEAYHLADEFADLGPNIDTAAKDSIPHLIEIAVIWHKATSWEHDQ